MAHRSLHLLQCHLLSFVENGYVNRVAGLFLLDFEVPVQIGRVYVSYVFLIGVHVRAMQTVHVHYHAVLPLLPFDHLERVLLDAERDPAELDNVPRPQHHPPVLEVFLGVHGLRPAGLGAALHLVLIGEHAVLNHQIGFLGQLLKRGAHFLFVLGILGRLRERHQLSQVQVVGVIHEILPLGIYQGAQRLLSQVWGRLAVDVLDEAGLHEGHGVVTDLTCEHTRAIHQELVLFVKICLEVEQTVRIAMPGQRRYFHLATLG